MNKKFYIFLFFIFCSLSFVCAGISVAPNKTELELNQGESYNGNFVIVRSENDDILGVNVSTRKWYDFPLNKHIKINDWFKMQHNQINFEENSSKLIIPFEITVPTSAVGEIMTMVSFSEVSNTNKGIIPVYSVPVYVFVKGTGKVDWLLKSMKLNIEKDGSLRCYFQIQSTGTVHFRPYGECIFYKKKKEIGRLVMKEGWPVYPGQTRTFICKGDFKPNKKARYWMDLKLMYNKAGKHGQMLDKRYRIKIKNGKVEIKE